MNGSFFPGPTDEYYFLLKWDRSHTDSTTFHVYRCKHWETLFTRTKGRESFIIATSLNSLNSFQHMCPKTLLSITEKSSLMIHQWQSGQSSSNSIWRIGNYQTTRHAGGVGTQGHSLSHTYISHCPFVLRPAATPPWTRLHPWQDHGWWKGDYEGEPWNGTPDAPLQACAQTITPGKSPYRGRGSEQGPPRTHTPACTTSLKPTAPRHMFADPGSMMPVKPEMEALFSSTPRKDREAGPEQRWERIKR